MPAGSILPLPGDIPAVVTLRPGRLHFAGTPTVVTTVLGSCVSATMHCARLGAGAICHALFPGGDPAAGDGAYRYVDRSIDAMAAWLDRIGAGRPEIEVKLFGGAHGVWSAEGAPAAVDVGLANVESALRTLARHGLRVAARDVGGTTGRKLYFVSHTGKVYVKRLPGAPGSLAAAPGRDDGPRGCP